MRIYAAAIFAKNDDGRIRAKVTVFLATDNLNAEGTALEIAREEYPLQDGWIGHQASIRAVPQRFIDQVKP